jgi:hypothetical protein
MSKSLEIEIRHDGITVITGGATFPLPDGAFGDAKAMADALHGYIQAHTHRKRLSVRLCVSTRKTVIRTSPAHCPFDSATHVLQADEESGCFFALPLALVNALVEMCRLLGIRLHRIEKIITAEHVALMRYGGALIPLCVLLPQESGMRVLLAGNGRLTAAHFISSDPAYRETELTRLWMMHRFVPEQAVYLSDEACAWTDGYFTKRGIPFLLEKGNVLCAK